MGVAPVIRRLYLLSSTRSHLPEVSFLIRSEEHTSELQSRPHLVCRLLLEKKKPHTPVRLFGHGPQLSPNRTPARHSPYWHLAAVSAHSKPGPLFPLLISEQHTS